MFEEFKIYNELIFKN